MIQTKRPHWHNVFHAHLRSQTVANAIAYALHPKAGEKREKLAMLWRYIVKKKSQAKNTNA
jgi:hypothetical protein